jgi:hypothetical protein
LVGSRNTFGENTNLSLFFISGGTNANTSSNANVVTIGQWTHIAFVLNSRTGYFHVNGIQVGTGNLSVVNAPSAGTNLRMGQRIQGGNILFDGVIDEARIWDLARTPSELLATMNSEFCAIPSNLKAYYKFNQGIANGVNSTSTTLTDNSGNSNNGTLINFALTGTSSNWVGGAALSIPSVSTGSIDTVVACSPYVLQNGVMLLNTGIFNDTVSNVFGCDSAYSINFTALPKSNASFSTSVCDGYYGPSGRFYSTTGVHVDTLVNNIGCDSLISISLTVNSSKLVVNSVSACKTYTSITGKIHTVSGTYFDTLTTVLSCDSVLITNLTITSDNITNYQIST